MRLRHRDRLATRRDVLAACAAALCLPHAAQASRYREMGWNALVPAQWNPIQELGYPPDDLDALQDTDPRAKAFMDKMRMVLDSAPVVAALHGTEARLPGYVVPLEQGRQGVREFLLVPYFGACIHSPPPAANQILWCRAAAPVAGLRTMEAVWVSGLLQVERSGSSSGVAGYAMRVARVDKQG